MNRNHTHDYSIEPKDLLEGSDFEKGWKIRVLYDKLGGRFLKQIFDINIIKSAYVAEWCAISAAKLIEDIKS